MKSIVRLSGVPSHILPHLGMCLGLLGVGCLLYWLPGVPPRVWILLLASFAEGNAVLTFSLLLLAFQSLCLLAAWSLLVYLLVQEGIALAHCVKHIQKKSSISTPPPALAAASAHPVEESSLQQPTPPTPTHTSNNTPLADVLTNPYEEEQPSAPTTPPSSPLEADLLNPTHFFEPTQQESADTERERLADRQGETTETSHSASAASTSTHQETLSEATGEAERGTSSDSANKPSQKLTPQERLETYYQELLAQHIPVEKMTIDMLRNGTHVKRATISHFLREKKSHAATASLQANTLPLEILPPSPAEAPHWLQAATQTSAGIQRANDPNEDSALSLIENQRGVFVVADGMGGHRDGREASQLVVQTMQEMLAPVLGTATEEGVRDLLVESVQAANAAIYQRNQSREARGPARMGSTVTAALIVDRNAYIVNVGDSRTYWQSRAHGLVQVSRDHSLVEQLIQAGTVRKEERYTHPKRNQITRSLGEREIVEIDAFFAELADGDRLLLCSDGLWEMIPDQQALARTLAEAATSNEQCCHALVEAALQGGGADNITALVVSYHQEEQN